MQVLRDLPPSVSRLLIYLLKISWLLWSILTVVGDISANITRSALVERDFMQALPFATFEEDFLPFWSLSHTVASSALQLGMTTFVNTQG